MTTNQGLEIDMVNLEKISDLLNKGIENPSFQNDEGEFSAKKWKTEVQEYTEPFLGIITERLNEALTKGNNVWQGNKFVVLRKFEGKQKRIVSLQEAKCKLPEPFAINATENDRRYFEGFIVIGPFRSNTGENYSDCVCWGLRWWGTEEKAQNVHKTILKPLNANGKFNALVLKDGGIGSFAWLFNHMSRSELEKGDMESIVEAILGDFQKLFSILANNKRLFGLEDEPKGPHAQNSIRIIMPTEKEVKQVIQNFETGQIKVSDIFSQMELFAKKKRYGFIEGWKTEVENILEKMSFK